MRGKKDSSSTDKRTEMCAWVILRFITPIASSHKVRVSWNWMDKFRRTLPQCDCTSGEWAEYVAKACAYCQCSVNVNKSYLIPYIYSWVALGGAAALLPCSRHGSMGGPYRPLGSYIPRTYALLLAPMLLPLPHIAKILAPPIILSTMCKY